MGISRLYAAARSTVYSAEQESCSVKTASASGKNYTSARDTAEFSELAQKLAETEKQYEETIAETAKRSNVKTESTNKSGKSDKTEKKSLSELIKEQTDKIDKMFSDGSEDRGNDNQLTSIKLKMRSGRILNASEERYLSKYDPDAYSDYRTTQDACRMFRCQLSSCRTRDEVNGMRLSNALSALSAYKKAIKQGGDGSAVAGLNMALEREISSFSQSARFRSLPTAAERDKYYMQLAKARRFEREKKLAERANANRKKKKQIKQPGDGKMTVSQVMNSPLGRKVRKSEKGGGGMCFSAGMFGTYKMNQRG